MRIGLSDLHSLFLHLFSNFEALFLEVSNIIPIFANRKAWERLYTSFVLWRHI